MKDEGREGKRRKEGVRVWLGGEREREREERTIEERIGNLAVRFCKK